MWKKDELQNDDTATERTTAPRPVSRGGSVKAGATADRATIGPSITIKGDVSGDEDLYIQGSVDGSVKLKEHNVTISSDGRVKANVYGRTITVQGRVDGDLFAEEQVVLRPTCHVRGNITAARVALEDGANFRGTIDMEAKEESQAGAAKRDPVETSSPRPPSAGTAGQAGTAKMESTSP